MAVTVSMPQLGETVTEGTILSWVKQPGDTIEEDEVLLEISTDKVDTEVPSPASGVIQEILVGEGETVAVGTALAVIATDQEAGAVSPAAEIEEAAAAASPAAQASAPEPAPARQPPPPAEPWVAEEPAAAAAVEESAVLEPSEEAPRRGILSPVVRKLASEHELDLSQVQGTGEGGRITRKDVQAFIAAAPTKVTLETAPAPAAAEPAPAPAPTPPKPAPAPPVPVAEAPGDQVLDIGRLRRRIAENMVHAKRTAAHVWTSVETDFENVERVRQAHRASFKAEEGFSLTYMPFIARATMDALAAFAVVNSSFLLEDGKHIYHRGVNLGIAVDLNQEGLVVVTIRAADGMTLKAIAREIRTAALKAREGRLEPDDISGSSFTITNPGPFGSFMSAPIINVPNVAILSTDTVTKRPAVVTLPDGSDSIAIRHIGYLGLTWDHRAFDGSTAVLFLQRIKENLETWDWSQELA